MYQRFKNSRVFIVTAKENVDTLYNSYNTTKK